MTNTYAATITLLCGNDHDVPFPANVTSGNVTCPIDGCDSWADVSHAFRHVGWCTVCGGEDSVHRIGCTACVCDECGEPDETHTDECSHV